MKNSRASFNIYISTIKKNVYETNNKGSNMIWVPKVKT